MQSFDLAALEAELTRDEGVRFAVYTDTTGNPTVGIGHNLNAGPLPRQTYPMTQAQVDALFAKDVASTVAKLDQHLSWWRSLDDVRQRVMINMTFNLGIAGLMTFVGFLSLVKAGQYERAAEDMATTLWARQVGNRAVRLANMMRSGTPVGVHPTPPAPIPVTTPAKPAPPPIPARHPNPLEQIRMNLSIFSLILKLLPLLPMLEANFELEVKSLASNADGMSKVSEFITVLEDTLAKVKAAIS